MVAAVGGGGGTDALLKGRGTPGGTYSVTYTYLSSTCQVLGYIKITPGTAH